jgi:sugar O-acyltransferase (sialic acid O-acetyltransferase NeuD family)
MMMSYGLIGAGGHGRETMPVLAEMIRRSDMTAEHRLMFVVEGADCPERVNGYPVVSLAEYVVMEGERYFNIAIADAQARERIANLCIAAGLRPLSIISKSALVLDNNDIGEGAILSPFSVVTSNARIGRFFHANIFSRVAHDCVIGDFVTFAPSAQCNGNVVVDDYAFIGTGAVIKEGTRECPLVIGKGATVGMGAVVTKDVAPFTTVVGNPARLLTQ